jgi:fumarate hydratase subunit alpha
VKHNDGGVMVSYGKVVSTTVELLRKAETKLDEDVISAIRTAYENEDNEIARINLKNILKNLEIAERKNVPMCQDTGLPVFFRGNW